MSRYIRGQLDRLRERIGQPETPEDGEARVRVEEALDTLVDLIHAHGDEIERDYEERVERGEDHKAALVAAKRAAWTKTEEGRAALAVADGLQEHGGRG